MNQLRNAFRSSVSLRSAYRPNQAFSSLLLRESSRSFSTGAEQPPQNQNSDEQSSGLVYGNLTGVSRTTLKTDILYLFRDFNLTPQDIRVNYNQTFSPISMLIQFPSLRAFNQATMMLKRKGNVHQLQKERRSFWDILRSYDGTTVCIRGVPQRTMLDDIERFLSGSEYDASSIKLLTRGAPPRFVRLAMVQYPSQIQAMNAVIAKNSGFILDQQISMYPLQ